MNSYWFFLSFETFKFILAKLFDVFIIVYIMSLLSMIDISLKFSELLHYSCRKKKSDYVKPLYYEEIELQTCTGSMK